MTQEQRPQTAAAPYEVLSDDSVARLHARFMAQIEKRAQDALARLPPAHGSALHGMAIDLLLYATRLRADDLTADKLVAALSRIVADRDPDAAMLAEKSMIYRAVELREKIASESYGAAEVPQKSLHAFNKAAAKRPKHDLVENTFAGKDRIYIRLRGEETPLQREIEKLLATLPPEGGRGVWGFVITDWSKGYATDVAGKQTYRIGALLRKHAPDLLPLFAARATDNLLIVISRKVSDIAAASTNRRWQSCAGAGGVPRPNLAFGKMDKGIRAGAMIAYLVADSDPDIHNPLARIMINPYVRNRSRDILREFTIKQLATHAWARVTGTPKPQGTRMWYQARQYGFESEAFRETVCAFVEDKFNGTATGRFWSADGIYNEGPTLLERFADMTVKRTPRWFYP